MSNKIFLINQDCANRGNLMSFIRNTVCTKTKKGIIALNGKRGVGRTWFLKALSQNFPEEQCLYMNISICDEKIISEKITDFDEVKFFLIDGLDVCSPEYLVKILNLFKDHIFDSDKIFILAMDKEYVDKSIVNYLGFPYLDNVVNITIPLSDKYDFKRFVEIYNINKYFGFSSSESCTNILKEIIELYDMNLSQLNNIFSKFNLLCKPSERNNKVEVVYSNLLLFTLLSYVEKNGIKTLDEFKKFENNLLDLFKDKKIKENDDFDAFMAKRRLESISYFEEIIFSIYEKENVFYKYNLKYKIHDIELWYNHINFKDI